MNTLKSKQRAYLAEGISCIMKKESKRRQGNRVCSYCVHVLCAHSEENTPLDLDDHGGRTFLRVLLHLTMHDYPPLVSRALHLLFRHFSQRQEVLQAFKQVTQ